jgi:hypothetical protein
MKSDGQTRFSKDGKVRPRRPLQAQAPLTLLLSERGRVSPTPYPAQAAVACWEGGPEGSRFPCTSCVGGMPVHGAPLHA